MTTYPEHNCDMCNEPTSMFDGVVDFLGQSAMARKIPVGWYHAKCAERLQRAIERGTFIERKFTEYSS